MIPCHGYDTFVDAVCAEISSRTEEIRASAIHERQCAGGPASRRNTLYIGGGTPSVLPAEKLGKIAMACHNAVNGGDGGNGSDEFHPFEEFTVEVNTDDIVTKGHAYVEALRSFGVNRVSMGVQSMDDRVLKWMNRRHDAASARKAYRILKDAGMENVSIDMIFGYNPACVLPAGVDASWSAQVMELLDIAGDGTLPTHISAYQLSIEEGSALAQMVSDGRYVELAEDECAEQYATLCRILRDSGYHHYEISNFALPGYEAMHNSAYWQHIPYAGIGPGAHSLCRSGRSAWDVDGMGTWTRSWNLPDVEAYIAASRNGAWSGVRESEILSRQQYREEEIMLSLRTDKGISGAFLAEDPCAAKNAEKLLRAGALESVGRDSMGGFALHELQLRISEDHMFVSDDIISELI